jgi:phage terminase large subunit
VTVAERNAPVEVMPGAQADFVTSKAMFPAFFAGRRGGKSVASTLKMLLYIGDHPGCTGLYTVPTLGDVNRILLRTLHKHWGYLKGTYWDYHKKDQELVFNTNPPSIVFVRPANEPDSCRGMDLSFAVMDEIGTENQKMAWEVIWPSLTESEDPQLWVTSTPNFRYKWIKEVFIDHIEPETGEPMDPSEFQMFHQHSLTNPHIPDRVRKMIELRSSSGSRWARQEYGGEFITMEGLAFEEFNRLRHVKTWVEQPTKRTICGMDFGDSSPTSIHIMRQTEQGHIWVTDEYYKRRAIETDWVDWLGAHNVTTVTCDPSLSEEQRLYYQRRYGIRFVRSKNKNRKSRRAFWHTQLAQNTISISSECPNLTSELENLAYAKPRGREYETDEWETGAQDHAFDSTAYAGAGFTEHITPPNVSVDWGKW